MSDLADDRRAAKRGWASPGGLHDWLMRFLKIALPAVVGLLLAYLLLSPLSKEKEVSFLLDKNKVDTARERLKTQKAEYRGLDDKGRPFSIQAAQAVQAKSSDPVIDIGGMAARILLEDGPHEHRRQGALQQAAKGGRARADPFTAAEATARDPTGPRPQQACRVSGGGVEGRIAGEGSRRRKTVTCRSAGGAHGRPRVHIEQGLS